MSKKFTAIAFDLAGKAYKYRNIQNKPFTLAKFESFCRSKQITYINYYCGVSKAFIRRQHIATR